MVKASRTTALARLACAAALAFGATGAAAADSRNWGFEKSELTAGFIQSKAVCRKLGDPSPPAADRPTPAQAKTLKGCDAEKLYYGERGRPDFAAARRCAFAQPEHEAVLGGPTILMQLYANGLGVARNVDLATAYACRIDGAPAERDGRVTHLQSLKAGAGKERFDYCDDITSGLAQGYCQGRASTGAAASRDARLDALIARAPAAARPLYVVLRKRLDAFVDAHGGGEVDLSGTARAAMVIAEEDATREQFRKDLDRLIGGRWPAAIDAGAADAQLNASYGKALAWAAGKENFSTVKPEDIRKAQRAWLAYRDAYVAFAGVAAPRAPAAAVLARLTRLRLAQLDALSG